MELYISAIFLVTLTLNADKTAVVPDVPFTYYAINCVQNGKDITYNLNDIKLAGTEALCHLSYRAAPYPGNPDVKVEKEVAENFPGYIGNDWDKVMKDARYIKHYNVTKEQALATTDGLGVTTPYTGIDKDEVVKFTQWEKAVSGGEK